MKTLSKLLLLVALIATLSCKQDIKLEADASRAVTTTNSASRIQLLEVTILDKRTAVYIIVVDDVEYFVNSGGGIVSLGRH